MKVTSKTQVEGKSIVLSLFLKSVFYFPSWYLTFSNFIFSFIQKTCCKHLLG